MTAEKTLDATSLALGPLTMSWRGSVTVTPGHGGGGDVGLAALRVGGWRVGRTHHRVSHAVGPGADGGHGTGGPGFCSRWQGSGSPACGEWRWEGLAPRVSWYLPRSANRPQTGCQSVGCDLPSHPGATKPPESGFLRFRVPVPSPLGPGLVRRRRARMASRDWSGRNRRAEIPGSALAGRMTIPPRRVKRGVRVTCAPCVRSGTPGTRLAP